MITVLFFLITIVSVISFIYILKDNKKNYSISFNTKQKNFLFWIFCIITSLAQILLLNFNYPFIGHDYSLSETHIISSFLHYKNNGLKIEWASPLFGAGTLQYANPQYTQFSILYFLTLIMPFWYATSVTIFIFSIIGFISIYLLLKNDFKCDFIISITSAVFFNCTGYYIYHLRAGHLSFIYHPLTALIVFIIFSNTLDKVKFNYIFRILLSSIIFSIMIFGGTIQTIFFYTCFTLLCMGAIFFNFNTKFLKQCISIILSVILGFILSLSKVLPMFMLSKKIDRGSLMLSNIKFYQIFEVIYYNFILSVISFIEKILGLNKFLNIRYNGIHEKDLSLPFFIIPIIIFIIIINRKKIKQNIISFNKQQKIKAILILIFIYLFFDMYYDKGIIHSIFPLLNKMNLHLRLSSTTIIPIIFLFCYLFNKYELFTKNKKTILLLIINLYTIVFFLYKHYDNFITATDYFSRLEVNTGIEVWKKINKLGSNNNYKVNTISNINESTILYQFLSNDNLYSSQYPYEPIYGYGLETFKAKEEGSIYKIKDNHYNFTHPNSLLFFNEDDYKQFTGFSTNQKEDLEKFASFKKVDWKLPKIFTMANYISIYSHIIVISIIIILTIINIVFYFKYRKI